MIAVEAPKQFTFVVVVVAERAAVGCVMTIGEISTVQPFASVTVTVYDPLLNPVKFCEIAPVFH